MQSSLKSQRDRYDFGPTGDDKFFSWMILKEDSYPRRFWNVIVSWLDEMILI